MFWRCTSAILAGTGAVNRRLGRRRRRGRRDRTRCGRRRREWRAGRTGDAAAREQVDEFDSAAGLAAFDPELIVSAQREQQQPGMFERNPGRGVQVEIGLVGDAQQGAGFQRSEPIARLEAEQGTAQQPVDDEQARELRGMKMQIRASEKIGGLARRLAAMSQYAPRALGRNVVAIQLADPIVTEPGPLTYREGARLVVDQPPSQIEPQLIARVTVVGNSHVLLPSSANPAVSGS